MGFDVTVVTSGLVDGLVALPGDARTREQLEWVAQDVEAAGGTAVLWRAETLALHDEQQVAASMAAGRAVEDLAGTALAATAGAGR